jgi:hypothetical protein
MEGVREAWTDERLDDLNLRLPKEFHLLVRILLVQWIAMIIGFVATIATVLLSN